MDNLRKPECSMDNLRRSTDATEGWLQDHYKCENSEKETKENQGLQRGQKEVTLRGSRSPVESDLSVWTPSIRRGEKGTQGGSEDVFCGLPSDTNPD